MAKSNNTILDKIKLARLKTPIREFIVEKTGEEDVLPPATFDRVLRGKGGASSRALVILAFQTMPTPLAEQ